MITSRPWVNLFGGSLVAPCVSEEGRRLASVSDISLRTCRQTVGKLFNFCCMVLNLQWWIQQESCHSFSKNLHVFPGFKHTEVAHTLVPSRWCDLAFVIAFFLYMNSETAVQRELHHCFAEILVLLVDKNLFLYCKICHSGLYLCCSEALCTRLSVKVIRLSQTLLKSLGISLSWGAQLCLAGFFFPSEFPKNYSTDPLCLRTLLHICRYNKKYKM